MKVSILRKKNIMKKRESLKAQGSPLHNRQNHQGANLGYSGVQVLSIPGRAFSGWRMSGRENSPGPLGNAPSSLNEMVVKSEYFKLHILNYFIQHFTPFFFPKLFGTFLSQRPYLTFCEDNGTI